MQHGLEHTIDCNWRHIYVNLCKIATVESPFKSASKSACLQYMTPSDQNGLLLAFKTFQSSLKNTVILQVFYPYSFFLDDSGAVTSSAGTTCQAHTHNHSNLGVTKSCIKCCAYFRDAHSPPPLYPSIQRAQVPALIQSLHSYTAQPSEVYLTLRCFSHLNKCCSISTSC